MSIKLSISGIRGQFHELVPNRVVKFAEAFSTYMDGGDVMLGMDGRPSGKYISEAVVAGLTSSGSSVFDYGVIPTPILQWIIKNSPYKAGISITAGHNSFDWNSLIFLNSEGSYLTHVEGEEFFNLFHSGNFTKRRFNRLGCYTKSKKYLQKYFNTFELTESAWRPMKFVIDCSNGFDSWVIDRLSEAMQIKGVPIFCTDEGVMHKDPEPNIHNASILGTIVRETRSDGGFLLNSDASRILVVDETGKPLSEELTLPIFARMVLEEEKGEVVTNYSTSKMVDQVAREFDCPVFRTDVGQPYVVQMVKDIKAKIGGEGSGSIVYSPFSLGFDSFVFIKKMVQYLRKHRCTISDIANSFTPPDIYKETIFLKPSKIYSFLERIRDRYSGKADKKLELFKKLKDGFYIDWGDEWLCVRASATVSMIRIVGEGKRIGEDIADMKELVG
jgi:phosphomannomutase